MSALSRFTLLAVFALCASAAHAVGLGPVEVRSFLNEPLRADIELRDVAPESLDELVVGVAPEEAFDAIGLARADYFRHVRSSIVLREGSPTVRLEGSRALREPLLDLLVVVRQGRQSVQRAYTLFIDPREFAETTAPGGTGIPSAEATLLAQQDSPEGQRQRNSNVAVAPQTINSVSLAESTTLQRADRGTTEAKNTLHDQDARNVQGRAGTEQASSFSAETEDLDRPPSTGVERLASSEEMSRQEQSPEFFKTESERQLDPELLAEIGEDSVEGTRSDTGSRPGARAGKQSTDSVYQVRRGETLWRVATNSRPVGAGVTMDQMMLAIVKKNPAAFEDGDVTRIRANIEIRLPNAEEAGSVSPAVASRQMAALTSGTSISSLLATSDANGSASQRLSPQPGPASLATPRDVQADAAPETAPTTQLSAVVREDADRSRKERTDVVAEGVQSPEVGLGQDAGTSVVRLQPQDTSATRDTVGGETLPTDDGGAERAVPSKPDQQETSSPGQTGTPDAGPSLSDWFRDTAGGFLQQLHTWIPGSWIALPWYLVLVVLGALTLCLAGIIELRRRAARRRYRKERDERGEMQSAMPSKTTSATAAHFAESSVETSPLDAPTAADNSVSDPSDEDPLADAEFRIAYGMYEDAADRLENAIARDPENAALRLKLAEVYCAAGDKERFLDAADVAARSGLSTEEEQELAQMASRIAPESRFATALGSVLISGPTLQSAQDDASEDQASSPDPQNFGAGDQGAEAGHPSQNASDANQEKVGFAGDALSSNEPATHQASTPEPFHEGEGYVAGNQHLNSMGAYSTQSGVEGQGTDNLLEFDLEDFDSSDEIFGDVNDDRSAGPVDEGNTLDFDLEGLELPDNATGTVFDEVAAENPPANVSWELPEERAESERGTTDNAEIDQSTGDPNVALGLAERHDAPLLDADGFDTGDLALDEFSLEDFDLDGSGDPAPPAHDADIPREDPPFELPDEPPTGAATETQSEDAFELDDFEIDPVAEGPDTTVGADEGLAGKLDLARAYVDMGEGEMARPLLEAVVQGGDATQREEAQRLLDISG